MWIFYLFILKKSWCRLSRTVYGRNWQQTPFTWAWYTLLPATIATTATQQNLVYICTYVIMWRYVQEHGTWETISSLPVCTSQRQQQFIYIYINKWIHVPDIINIYSTLLIYFSSIPRLSIFFLIKNEIKVFFILKKNMSLRDYRYWRVFQREKNQNKR